MGFLSRKKNKHQPPAEPELQHYEPTPTHAVAEEPHPIVEELEQMEAAVPERRYDDSYESSLEADGPLLDEPVESYTDEDYENDGYDDAGERRAPGQRRAGAVDAARSGSAPGRRSSASRSPRSRSPRTTAG